APSTRSSGRSSPRGLRRDPAGAHARLPERGRRQHALGQLPPARGRHHRLHAGQERHDVDADVLRAPDPPVDDLPAAARPPVALARAHPGPDRRSSKPHTPLDGIPYWPEVSYVFCGRDPRDVFLSGIDHMNNASDETEQDMMRRLGVTDRMELPDDPNVYFPIWLRTSGFDGLEDGFPMGSVLGFTKTYWDHRDAPNLFFLHYTDLSADLDGEMRRPRRSPGDGRVQDV